MNDNFDRFSGTSKYITSLELRHSVNVSMALGRPLLVKGEPGTGKTLLAHAIAEDLNMELVSWNVKSTSKAVEGLYIYDTVQRLQDSRFEDRDVSDIRQYIKLGPLGRALTSQKQVVLLIDEIDKADLEFPNDLLHELDSMEFTVTETGDSYRAVQRPAVIITSNAEKELPDPFLRRCIFHYIQFPEASLMTQICKVHHRDLDKKLLEQCLAKFYWLREMDELRKRPSTSELIDWMGALIAAGISPDKIKKEIPFLGTLLKKPEDIELLENGGSSRRGKWR